MRDGNLITGQQQYSGKVAELRSRGVQVEEYDEPGRKTVDGIADGSFALSAWLVDPHRNSIGLLQFKDAGTS